MQILRKMRSKIAAFGVKISVYGILMQRMAPLCTSWALDVAMGGDDDAERNGGD